MSDALICARPECDNVIEVKASWNQKYCSSECTRIETNRRIMQKYYDKKDRVAGKRRICELCEDTVLSRYNDDKVCYSCQRKAEKRRNEEFARMLEEMTILDDD